MTQRLSIVGAGAVGQSVAELADSYGYTVTAIADSRSAAVDDTGLDIGQILGRKRTEGVVGPLDPEDAIAAKFDILVEATPTTLGDAEPGFSHVATALAHDHDVVLANKGPIAERYGELRKREQESAGTIRFEATVGGAIPILSIIEDHDPAKITAARGVLNGTANFILTRMAAEGLDYEHVLAEAQDLGVAEADPTFDVEGTDAALKCVILANVLSEGAAEFSLDDADVTGISSIPGSALELAAEDGYTVRLIGEATRETVRVGPRLVPEHGTLAVTGTQNIVQLDTHHAGRLNVSGRGAGGAETATAVFADIRRLTQC